jgi:poly-gamma-glutamate capsule biosynthesis protein CapA/YwtB (metallophosphatase superfamily)
VNKSHLSVLLVGDMVPSRRLCKAGTPMGEEFRKTVALLDGADIVFGNLEAPLSTHGAPREKLINFRSDPAIAADLRAIGFDILSLANNHSMDYGGDALVETIQVLNKNGIRTVGAGGDIAEASEPVVIVAGEWRVGFVAWSCLPTFGSAASSNRPGHSPLNVRTAFEMDNRINIEEPGHAPTVKTWIDAEELAAAQDAVRALKGKVDFTVASVHWGYGSGPDLAQYQPAVGRALIDAGADLVVGHHVHAVLAVEAYKNRAILYSTGGFIAQQPREGQSPRIVALLDQMSPDGYAAVVDATPDGGYDLKLVPTMTDKDGLPKVVTGPEFRRIAKQLESLSETLGTEVRSDGNGRLVVSLR